MSDINEGELSDVGVLFVHGIGQSRQGETLLRFGEPLRACIERYAQPAEGKSKATTSVTEAALIPDEAGVPAHARLTISDIKAAVWSGSEGKKVTQPESHWLLAEAWWAEKFPVPTFGEFAEWSFKVLPWTLVAHFDRRFRWFMFYTFGLIRGARKISRISEAFFHGAATVAALISALMLSPLIILAVALIMLLGIVPITAVRKIAANIQRVLAAYVGDSYVFMQQPLVAAAICTTVREQFEWLAARSRRVVIIAHSQGAAVAHKVLRETATAPCDVFISFGSGLSKLTEMEEIQNSEQGRRRLTLASLSVMVAVFPLLGRILWLWIHAPAAALLPPVFGAGAMILYAMTVLMIFSMWSRQETPVTNSGQSALTNNKDWWRAAITFFIFALVVSLLHGKGLWIGSQTDLSVTLLFSVGLAVAYSQLKAWHRLSGRWLNPYVQARADRERYLQKFALMNRETDWYDFYASEDPVPNGQLLDAFRPGSGQWGLMLGILVSNQRSFFFDHTTYWENADEYVPLVTDLALKQAGIERRPIDNQRIAQRRSWRTRWLWIAKRTLTALAVLLVVQWLFDHWLQDTPKWTYLFSQMLGQPVSATAHAASITDAWSTATVHANTLSLMSQISNAALPWLIPIAASAVLWGSTYSIVCKIWSRWDRKETDLAFTRGWYQTIDPNFLWLLAVLTVSSAVYLWLMFGITSVAFPFVAVLVYWLALAVPLLWNMHLLSSASGDPNELKEMQKHRLKKMIDATLSSNDARELHRLGLAIEELDYEYSKKALQRAVDLKLANAAWSLGYMLYCKALGVTEDTKIQRLPGESVVDLKQRLIEESLTAFGEGAAIGDPSCSYWRANLLKDAGRKEEAIVEYQRAIELGHDLSAHSLALLLKEFNKNDEITKVYKKGVQLGDPLSAVFLAGDLVYSVEFDKLDVAERELRVTQALVLFDQAFNRGYIDGAKKAADLLDSLDRIDEARARYAVAVRFHSASAALSLGLLEEKKAQDFSAARVAYQQAIRFDKEGGYNGVHAQYQLGCIAELEERFELAKYFFRSVYRASGAPNLSAQAGLTLAQLIGRGAHYDKEIEDLLVHSTELDPERGSEPLTLFLDQHRAHNTAQAVFNKAVSDKRIDRFSPKALWHLGRSLGYEYEATACELYERAVKKFVAEAAVDLIKIASYKYDKTRFDRLLNELVAQGQWFAESVATGLEEANYGFDASKLRDRINCAKTTEPTTPNADTEVLPAVSLPPLSLLPSLAPNQIDGTE